MRPRLLADADFNHKIVVGVRRREPSVDFPSAHEAGVIGLSDPDVIGVAAQSGRIIVLQALDIGVTIENLLLVWAATDAEEWLNRLGFIPVQAACR